MCGITGAVALNHKTIDIDFTERMVDIISHRGPDDAGYLFYHTGCRHIRKVSFFLDLTDKRFRSLSPLLPYIQDEYVQRELGRHDWDLFFGHRRLAIIDLSPSGHQPMSDLSKNIWIVYNGEIYNFKEIRLELQNKGYTFRSETDTEVIIYSYIEWGIECIKRFNGMFAFALYDNFKKYLFFVRDRYGIKPLYYTVINKDGKKTLIFGSEIKSILEYKDYSPELDYKALIEYFTFQNILTDRTLWKGIKILPPGYYMSLNLNDPDPKLKKIQYWDFNFTDKFINKDKKELEVNLNTLFINAVKKQLIADVEIGAYLSGGIDSGSITAITSKNFSSLKTFSIGFDKYSASGLELSYDERPKAELISYLYKTEHYEMVLKAGDMERCMKDLVWHLEDLRVGQSYPNYYIAKLASKFVKVVLAGTGGDELFGGYPWRYYRTIKSANFEEYIDNYYLYWQRLIPNKSIKAIFSPIWSEVKDVW
ncbi:MAG: asparagine synthase (glutamine-hydrolyzing), partial [Spirochaetes bacterium]